MHWFLVALLIGIGKPLVWGLCWAILLLSLIGYLSISLGSLLMTAVFSLNAGVFGFPGKKKIWDSVVANPTWIVKHATHFLENWSFA